MADDLEISQKHHFSLLQELSEDNEARRAGTKFE